MQNASSQPTLQKAFTGLDASLFSAQLNQGKVRDVYAKGDERLLVATDRISAFDRVVGAVAGRGQVLNLLAAWWLKEAAAICQTHFIALEDAHSSRVKAAQTLPVEVIVRGFITGSTKTSLWTMYEDGAREAYGIKLPDGLKKNDALPSPLITPTTKAEYGGHDAPVSPAEIVAGGIVEKKLWQEIERVALELFTLGQAKAKAAGLVLVDTKYEFGLINGKLALIDEVHTPDSSRYWSISSLAAAPNAPESYDKEQLRLWLAANHYKGEGEPPVLSNEIQNQILSRYAFVYEKLAGKPLALSNSAYNDVLTSVNRFFNE